MTTDDHARRQAPGLTDSVHDLTSRERDVLDGIAKGLSNAEIAAQLFLGINSIKTYIRTAYRKIGARSRSQAVLWALEHGLGHPRIPETELELEPAPQAHDGPVREAVRRALGRELTTLEATTIRMLMAVVAAHHWLEAVAARQGQLPRPPHFDTLVRNAVRRAAQERLRP